MLKTSKEDSNVSPTRVENESPNTSYLGPNIRFEGELSGQEDLIIRGHVKGKIQLNQNNLIIEENGNIQAEIQAGKVTIRGKIKGNILATEKVTITKDGSMTGEITSPRISIEDGAQFKGSVKMDTKKSMIHQPHLSEQK
jgi:cytoskeletal protein CcmA (bactofilin family)